MKKLWPVVAVFVLCLSLLPAPILAQGGCDNPPPRLEVGRHGIVTPGLPVRVRAQAGLTGEEVGKLDPGTVFEVVDGPQCADSINWWLVSTLDVYGVWLAEGQDGRYFVEPYQFVPPTPQAVGVPMTAPVITSPTVPLPAVAPSDQMPTLSDSYAVWDWDAVLASGYLQAPDPLTLRLPAAYAGDFPSLPVNLDTVRFVTDANLNPAQLALLAQNGFVVIPGGWPQFDQVYNDDTWPQAEGRGDFITTDAFLHALFLTYQNALMFLELGPFYADVSAFVGRGYQAAEAQWQGAIGTPLEQAAFNAAVYYAVPLRLLADGEEYYTDSFSGESLFGPEDATPLSVLAGADPTVLTAAQHYVDLIRAAAGIEAVSFMEDLQEDFTQYRPRSYYAGNPLLEAYFRAMMWLGRITFKANSAADTLTGLLALRALQASDAYTDWAAMADTLAFLVGPMDDLSPVEYGPLAEQTFGAGLPLDALADPTRLDAFRAATADLPGPRVNSIPLPMDIAAGDVDAYTRGFRLFGQRFTLDGYLMQQLIDPEVAMRALPMGLDVAAVLGSDHAYALIEAAGGADYAGYPEQVASLREEVNTLDADAWMQNAYGGWLWALGPLLVRQDGLYPPLMETDAWRYKDLIAALGSWTELKHATLLYAEQPLGGLGGGGITPPVTSTTIVEPNPEVFARIAIVAATLANGLEERGLVPEGTQAINSVYQTLQQLAVLSAMMADFAARELAGEPLTYDELYFLQESFGNILWYLRFSLDMWNPDPPEDVALVADVASNSATQEALEEAIGLVDTIYVVANGPNGLHLTRGGVYSQYEFTRPISQRMTDDEWRALLNSPNAPSRHDWTRLFFSE